MINRFKIYHNKKAIKINNWIIDYYKKKKIKNIKIIKLSNIIIIKEDEITNHFTNYNNKKRKDKIIDCFKVYYKKKKKKLKYLIIPYNNGKRI